MNIVQSKLQDSLLATGLALIPLSLAVYCIPLFNHDTDNFFAVFIINFCISVTYFFVLLFNKRNKIVEHKRHYTFLLLILLLISAYSLNREMTVFNASPLWFFAALIALCANYIGSIFFHHLPAGVKLLQIFLMGVASVVFFYLSVYLFPLYFISVIGLIIFGVAIHTYVPLLFTIYTCILVKDLAGGKRKHWLSFGSGIVVVLIVIASYTVVWSNNKAQISKAYVTAIAEGSDDLPAWIQVAQRIDQNATTEKILKTELVYTLPDWEENGFWDIPRRRLGEQQLLHDPLVVVASLFTGRISLSEDERINILKSVFGARHHTEERLWTGKDLTTQNVITSVRVWPELHLAYTEKTITVFNHSVSRWLGNQQEGIYTFHLPEGAVVTSLSLWINGKEEKGILTTKEKADSAYTGIVGVERRDPSMIHWQEGSRVSVRVFPVMSNDSRRFKIGITSPLRKDGDQLVYDNTWFDGPDASDAEETVRFNLGGRAPGAFLQTALLSGDEKSFVRTGNYRAKWSYAVPDEGISPHSFSFNGHKYYVKGRSFDRVPVETNKIYLDINEAWTRSEFEKIWQAAKGKTVWVYNQELIQLNVENRIHYFNELAKQRFSLFPLFAIKDADHSLLISKTSNATPNLSDVDGSAFANKLKAFPSNKTKVRLFHLGNQPSAYLSTLKDYRLFRYESGDVALLEQLLSTSRFVRSEEADDEVVLHSAQISIVKEEGMSPNTAPDHLMRMFAYNHILKQYGEQGFGTVKDFEPMIDEAKEAYVVSPVSSLIVLETQKDYDRYGIEDSKNSLKNASIKSTGAVPEPHEWVLIFLVGIIGIYLFMKSRI